MGFPTTGILDNFNRNNEGPPPSTNWSAGYSGALGQWKVVSNECVVHNVANGYCHNYWNVETFGSYCEVYVTIVTIDGTGSVIIGLRVVDIGGVTPDGYSLVYDAVNTQLTIERVDNGARTRLGAVYDITLSNGDKIGLKAVGSTLTAYADTGAGWTELFSRTDATYSAAGYVNLITDVTGYVCDDFGGGNYAPTKVNAVIDPVKVNGVALPVKVNGVKCRII